MQYLVLDPIHQQISSTFVQNETFDLAVGAQLKREAGVRVFVEELGLRFRQDGLLWLVPQSRRQPSIIQGDRDGKPWLLFVGPDESPQRFRSEVGDLPLVDDRWDPVDLRGATTDAALFEDQVIDLT